MRAKIIKQYQYKPLISKLKKIWTKEPCSEQWYIPNAAIFIYPPIPKELLCFKCKGFGGNEPFNVKKFCIICLGRGIPPIPECELGN